MSKDRSPDEKVWEVLKELTEALTSARTDSNLRKLRLSQDPRWARLHHAQCAADDLLDDKEKHEKEIQTGNTGDVLRDGHGGGGDGRGGGSQA